jgi:hypothetical protein
VESQLRPPGIELRQPARSMTIFVIERLEGAAVDILFLTVFAVFLLFTLALVAGCAALERKK